MNDKELMDFIKWLPDNSELFSNLNSKETIVQINKLSSSEDGKETLKQLAEQYKNKETKLFKDGGKLKHLLCLKAGGKGPDCGCNKVTKAAEGTIVIDTDDEPVYHRSKGAKYMTVPEYKYDPNSIKDDPYMWTGKYITVAVSPEYDVETITDGLPTSLYTNGQDSVLVTNTGVKLKSPYGTYSPGNVHRAGIVPEKKSTQKEWNYWINKFKRFNKGK